jgi:hypothetical protein
MWVSGPPRASQDFHCGPLPNNDLEVGPVFPRSTQTAHNTDLARECWDLSLLRSAIPLTGRRKNIMSGSTARIPELPCFAVFRLRELGIELPKNSRMLQGPRMLPAETFLSKLQTALDTGAFVKLTLSSPLHSAPGLRNVYGRVVVLKGGPQFSILLRYATRDITKNFPISEVLPRIQPLVETEFASAHLFTTSGDWELRQRPGDSARLSARRATFTVVPPPEHDRLKSQSVPSDVSYLQSLGVTNAQGAPKPGMADKLRQIQRFVEIFGHLLSEQEGLRESTRPSRPLQVVDMGAGKGYLTFAVADFLRNKGLKASVKGVEFRADLVELTNQVAKDAGMDGLHFEQGTIAEQNAPSGLDVLIALHACDTATDDALFHGISSGASLIITAPCCHKELRPQITPPPVLADVFRHGILCERQSEILTDGIRALLLEIHGYKASVFEFVSHEHTGKNLMLAAVKRPRQTDPNAARQRLRELLALYGITTQRLARLLGELEVATPAGPASL